MWLLLLLLIPCQAYNTTHDILRKIQVECKHPRLTCTYHNEILVVDWNAHKKRDIVWNFNEHARELITGELALHMIYKLPEMNPSNRITIIPILNVWGRTRAFNSPCQRKNKHGIDINRNFWTKNNHKKYKRWSQEYEGDKSISEKESVLLASIIKDANRYINVHSGEFSIYMPYDGSYNKPNTKMKSRFIVGKYCYNQHWSSSATSLSRVYERGRLFGRCS